MNAYRFVHPFMRLEYVLLVQKCIFFFNKFLFILGISVVLCLLAKPILTKMGPNEIVSFYFVTLHLKRFYLVLFF